jgi:hypothetical protein
MEQGSIGVMEYYRGRPDILKNGRVRLRPNRIELTASIKR